MPKAIEVATELRKLADSLENAGDVTVPYAFVSFRFDSYAGFGKDDFLAFAKNIMPRPFKKEFDQHTLRLTRDNGILDIWAKIDRDKVCTIIEPAKPAVYDCDPLFSDAEVAEVGE